MIVSPQMLLLYKTTYLTLSQPLIKNLMRYCLMDNMIYYLLSISGNSIVSRNHYVVSTNL